MMPVHARAFRRPGPLVVCLCALGARPAYASFHFMQIEQVIGGVNDDPTAQAIQLRMRSAGQNEVQKARLVARDAAGENPVELIDFEESVAEQGIGVRVLVATAGFADVTLPSAQPDFTMTSPIPEDYLAAGSITLENDDGTLIVWRLSWGGDSYTGSTIGALTNSNSSDGDFGPPIAAPLSTDGLQALLYQGEAAALAGANIDDYALTTGAASFTNNAGATFTVTENYCPSDPDKDAPGVCGCGVPDDDSDGDGTADCDDACPNDPAKVASGACGCGAADPDADGDGTPDCNEVDTGDTAPGDTGAGDGADGDDPVTPVAASPLCAMGLTAELMLAASAGLLSLRSGQRRRLRRCVL